MRIRSLEIDLDKNILKINGKENKEIPVIVTLPRSGSYRFAKLFNQELATGKKEECDKLEVNYIEATSIGNKL